MSIFLTETLDDTLVLLDQVRDMVAHDDEDRRTVVQVRCKLDELRAKYRKQIWDARGCSTSQEQRQPQGATL